MKFSVISIAALATIAAAQPHQRHQHKHPAKRRDVVVDIVTINAPAAIVYVNEHGQPISTSYGAQAAPTNGFWGQPAHHHHHHHHHAGNTATQPAPLEESTSATNSASPASYTSQAPVASWYSSPDSSASAPPPASSSPSSGSGGSGSGTSSLGYGLSYDAYNADSSCKSQDQVNQDINALPKDYGMIRIYGTDCNQASTVLSAAKAKGMKLFAGIYDISEVQSETQTLISAAENDWDSIAVVSVGNEAVNDGVATVDQAVAAVNQARSMLRSAGYNGPVVNVDVFDIVIANPALCQASDFAAANCHAFFDGDLTADQAGSWVHQQAQRVQQACGGKETMITESGWPSQGAANGQAVPSQENQQAAISSLKSSFSSNIVIFEAYNDAWKTNTAATYGAEQYWGIYGNSPSS